MKDRLKYENKFLKSYESLNEIILYMKNIALKNKKIRHENFTNKNFAIIESKEKEEKIVKTINLFELGKDCYLLAIYEYEENSLKIKSLDIGLFNYEVKWASATEMMCPLTNILLKRAIYKKHWSSTEVTLV